MHPSEMKNSALVAAAKARQDGFLATAAALLAIAEVCAEEARQLVEGGSDSDRRSQSGSPTGSGLRFALSH
jgi:hypothetical protein